LSELNFLREISTKKKSLIDYSNLKDNLFPCQNLETNKTEINNIFNSPEKGLPILFLTNLPFFKYRKNSEFKINSMKILEKIFLTNNKKYPPFQNYTNSEEKFVINLKVKKEYEDIITKISNFNKKSIDEIKKINSKFKETCAFQTRNIPHLGHEKIIENLLKKFDHVVVNPLIGPKKMGDVKFDVLKQSYDYVINNKFKNKVTYIPIIANMFYAGPREAIHHANLRKSLGFKNFVVGRDHAGAFDNYKPLDAYKLVSKYKNKLNINIINLKGAYHCKDCKKIVINFSCKHKNYENISGTQFRKKLNNKKMFVFADKLMQKKLHKIKTKIFE